MWGISREIRGGLVALLCALLGGWVFGLSQPVLAADSVVTDIRVGAQGRATRIVFDLTRKIAFATFSLAKPDRIVIDLPEVGWQLPAQPLPAASGVFRQMRYGLFQPGNSRVVLDIQKPAAISQAYVLEAEGKQPYRLVLELVPVSRTAFLQGIGKPSPRVTSSQPTPDKSRSARSAANSGLAPPPAAAPVTVVASATKTLPPSAKLQPVHQLHASPFKLPPRKPSPRRPGQKHVIVIDSGHGGVDPGTIGISGIYEKHVTLAMARELKKQLEATGRFKAVLTRDRDIFIRRRDRVQKSRDAKAELFISIHADTVKNPKIKGPAVYTLSEKASDKEAHELAEKENKADLIAAAANACVQDDLASWDGNLPPGMTPGQAFYLLGAQVRADFSAPGHRDEAVLRLESYLAASRDEGLRERIVPTLEKSVQHLASFIRGAQESGEFDSSFDPESFARFLHAVGSGIGSLSVAYGDEFDAEALWDQLIQLAGPSFSEAFRASVASPSGVPEHAPD